jgi:hypothetical protein
MISLLGVIFMHDSCTLATINPEAIEHLVTEWKHQTFHWPVMDTPLSQADAFQESVLFLFLGSLIHYDLDGIIDLETTYSFKKQKAEGSPAFWRVLRSHWGSLKNHHLTFQEFEHIFHGLESLPQRYAQWTNTLHILRHKYGGQATEFLESCQYNIPIILERAGLEFPSFSSVSGYSRLHLFLYWVQGKYSSTNLFHGLEQIRPFLDSTLLAGLIQTRVLELNEHQRNIPYEQFKDMILAAEQALDQLLKAWQDSSKRKILPADLNTPLRQQGRISIWRERFPLGVF